MRRSESDAWTWHSGADGWSHCVDPHAVTSAHRRPVEVLTLTTPGVQLLPVMPIDADDFDEGSDDSPLLEHGPGEVVAPLPPSLTTMLLRGVIDFAALVLTRRVEEMRRDA